MKNTKNNHALRTALVLGITLGSAGAMSVTDAQAFGWSDVTGAAKKVGGAVKDGAKKVGGAAYKAHKEVRRAKKKVRDFGRDLVGQAHYRPLIEVAKGIDSAYHKTKGTYDQEEFDERWRGSDRDIRTLVDAANSYSGVKDRVKRTVIDASQDAARKAWEKAQSGKLTYVPPRDPRFQPGRWGQNGNPLAQGLVNRTPKKRAPVQGITLKNTRPAKGLTSKITLQKGAPAGPNTIPLAKKGSTAPVQGIRKENLRPSRGKPPKTAKQGRPLGNDRSIWGRPVGGKKPVGNDRSLAGRPVGGRKPIGNDRSIWGRPVGGKKPVGQDRSKPRRAMGITKQNLQPRQKTKRLLQTKQKFTRDLSRNKGRKGSNGRKIQTKHQGFKAQVKRKVQIKRQNFKAQGKRKSFQLKRGSTKRSFNKGGRGNRRG